MKFDDPQLQKLSNADGNFLLMITPNIPEWNETFSRPCRIERNIEYGILKIIIPQSITEYKSLEYPYLIDLTIQNEHSATFSLSMYGDIGIDDALILKECFTQITEKKFRRLIINVDNTQLMASVPPPIISDNINDENFGVYSKLYKNYNINLPIGYQLDYYSIAKLNEVAETQEIEDIQTKIKKIRAGNPILKRTNVYAVLLGKDSEVLSVAKHEDINGWFNYKNLGIKCHNKKKLSEWKSTLSNHGSIMIVAGIRGYSKQQVYTKMKDIISRRSEPILPILAEFSSVKSGLFTCILKITFEDVKDKILWSVQDIVCTVSDLDEEYEKINNLHTMLLQEDYVDAIPLLEEFQDKKTDLKATLAYAYYENGEFEKSINTATEVISEDSGIFAYFTKGLSYIELKDYRKAFYEYRAGIKNCVWDYNPAIQKFNNVIDRNPLLKEIQEIQNIIKLFQKTEVQKLTHNRNKNR